jgi:predicted nucleotidyltransferase
MYSLTAIRNPGQFKNRDFIETPENIFFCVVGEIHPDGYVIAYPRYIATERASTSIWRSREGLTYERLLKVYSILSLKEALKILDRYPYYLRDLDAWGVRMSCIPVERIVRHLKPEERLEEIMRRGPSDKLESKLTELVDILSSISGIPSGFFGVTGSILLGIHNPIFSDIDLTVYGLKESLKIKEIILDLKNGGMIKELSPDHIERSIYEKSLHYPIGVDDLRRIYERMWQRGIFRDVNFSVHPERLLVDERYGDRVYRNLGIAKARLEIVDDTEGIFLPAVYSISMLELLEGDRRYEVEELVSFDGFFSSAFHVGDRIEVKAKLEEVYDRRRSRVYNRLVLGTLEYAGVEYAKFI